MVFTVYKIYSLYQLNETAFVMQSLSDSSIIMFITLLCTNYSYSIPFLMSNQSWIHYQLTMYIIIDSTVEPPSKGHFGTSHFVPCREAVLFLEVEMHCIYTFGEIGSILCREVVPFSEGPLLEVPLYIDYTTVYWNVF